jgi:hypothetical protein
MKVFFQIQVFFWGGIAHRAFCAEPEPGPAHSQLRVLTTSYCPGRTTQQATENPLKLICC